MPPAAPSPERRPASPPGIDRARVRVEVDGAVQGVGFRPFVYRTARELGLSGWVVNDTRGVRIEAQAAPDALERFLARLRQRPPPRAVIREVRVRRIPTRGGNGRDGFRIRESDARGARTAFVLPDLATCPACLEEVLSPGDRRWRYPFTNCTDCGPRFSIVRALPYDRPHTTMAAFRMCASCAAEYGDPGSRRFHAQPNACPDCGPHLELLAPDRGDDGARRRERTRPAAGAARRLRTDGGRLPRPADPDGLRDDEVIQAAARALRAGGIVAVKGLGGFHLMTDAGDEEAVRALRRRKGRPSKPLAVMARDAVQAGRLCRLSAEDRRTLESPEAPILLAERLPDAPVAPSVAPGNPRLGVMLAYTPLHHLLLRAVGGPLVATSGNRSEEPICTDRDEARARLSDVADLFVVHDRPIERHVDDSVVWRIRGKTRVLRRARGFAPLPVRVPRELTPVLAAGGHLKNTVALARGREVFVSQHIGDLETVESQSAFRRVVADFLRLYEVRPAAVAHDLHPDYVSTIRAREWAREGWPGDGEDPGPPGGAPAAGAASDPDAPTPTAVAVQHHHAHLVSCLAEHGLEETALGVVWDGAGHGPDGTVWGGEFLVGDASGYRRAGHLLPFRLPGGDAAARAPDRVAAALLWEMDRPDWDGDLDRWTRLSPGERPPLRAMVERGVRSPRTTSAGRLFDGVAALLGIRSRNSFEGEAAMALEFAADDTERGAYPFDIRAGDTPDAPLVVDWRPALEAMLRDRERGIEAGTASARFHRGLADAAVHVAVRIGRPTVALTGGCFQNRRLTEACAAGLERRGLRPLLHRQVPPGDGGLSLGQAVVAAERLRGVDGTRRDADDFTRERGR